MSRGALGVLIGRLQGSRTKRVRTMRNPRSPAKSSSSKTVLARRATIAHPCGGRHAGHILENAAEVALLGKSDLQRDLGLRHRAREKKLLRFCDARIQLPLVRRQARRGL